MSFTLREVACDVAEGRAHEGEASSGPQEEQLFD
jgi:hypothetical protein